MVWTWEGTKRHRDIGEQIDLAINTLYSNRPVTYLLDGSDIGLALDAVKILHEKTDWQDSTTLNALDDVISMLLQVVSEADA